MFISDKELVNKSNSIGCFYNSVNTVLDEFINYIKNGSDEFFKNYQKSEIKFLKDKLKKLKRHLGFPIQFSKSTHLNEFTHLQLHWFSTLFSLDKVMQHYLFFD